MFDHEYFVGWMKKLLLSLKERNISNLIIIMDNAKYHKKLSSQERIKRRQTYNKHVNAMVLHLDPRIQRS